ncbi:hypothetical protein SAMN05216578_102231 [Halopseudomonas formosensis]|uniref:Tetratricopeptide repeat-containing protein n=1 Tax=Halopseudomonas formosensis TaxID=1002526 RepID=A0A1I6AMB2_9GAMM|nr:hypothetical protein [Halopseudomonas formosensis]SFQ69833.1 hypothetical protein SAMN05216578_102231 [Halopseudomonas formosensis]
MRRYLFALLLALPAAVMASLPPSLDQAVQRISADDANNRVLNQLQAATLALDLGNRELAGELFDAALATITSVYADSEQAARARSLWYDEGAKDFKGEPYERAMAFYYRGLLDMYAGDYENARASFKSGLLQDAFAEEEQHRADFALLMFLEAWSSHVLGARGLADERFEELLTFRPGFRLPEANHRLLVMVETGKAPRKLQDGIGGNVLVYRPGRRFREEAVRIRVDGKALDLTPIESIFWQASSRGGRPIDSILEGQVQFKQTTQSVSADVSGVAAHATMLSPAFGAAGGVFAGVAAVAGVATLATSRVKARADHRFWNNLPDKVHVLTMPMPASREVQVEFLDASGAVINELTQTARIEVDAAGRGVLWARARRATDVDRP